MSWLEDFLAAQQAKVQQLGVPGGQAAVSGPTTPDAASALLQAFAQHANAGKEPRGGVQDSLLDRGGQVVRDPQAEGLATTLRIARGGQTPGQAYMPVKVGSTLLHVYYDEMGKRRVKRVSGPALHTTPHLSAGGITAQP